MTCAQASSHAPARHTRRVTSSHDDAIASFWADARVRGKLNRFGGVLGATVSDTVPPPAWAFGDDALTADRLLALVLEGRKTATASALRDYEEEARELARAEADADRDDDSPAGREPGAGGGAGGAGLGPCGRSGRSDGDVLVDTDLDLALPSPDLLSIVLDGAGHPRALIRTTEVQVVRFADVPAEHARREGEGSLEEWRRVHREAFRRSSATQEPVDDDTMVVLEHFEVLVPASAHRAARRHGL